MVVIRNVVYGKIGEERKQIRKCRYKNLLSERLGYKPEKVNNITKQFELIRSRKSMCVLLWVNFVVVSSRFLLSI